MQVLLNPALSNSVSYIKIELLSRANRCRFSLLSKGELQTQLNGARAEDGTSNRDTANIHVCEQIVRQDSTRGVKAMQSFVRGSNFIHVCEQIVRQDSTRGVKAMQSFVRGSNHINAQFHPRYFSQVSYLCN